MKRFGVGLIVATLLGCGGAEFVSSNDTPSTSDAATNDEAPDRVRIRLDLPDAPNGADGAAPDVAHVEAAADAPPIDVGAAPDTPTVDAFAADVEACIPITHSNGLGATYVDCVPLNTFDNAQALKACRATYGSSCVLVGYMCGHDVGSNSCACWQIVGSNAGWVFPGVWQMPAGCAGTVAAKMWN